MNRIDTGYQLYLKGKVKLEHADDQGLIFEVEGSDHGTYQVEYDFSDGSWRCICPDFHGRHKKANGAFLCKHIHGCIFKLAEIKGLHEQTTLEDIILEHEKEVPCIWGPRDELHRAALDHRGLP